MSAVDPLHAVHERFAGSDPTLPNGFAEHTPMGAEAMLALGLDEDAITTWAERHRPTPLGGDDPLVATRDALLAELGAGDWRTGLRGHLDTLLPVADAHLFHGLIRTAHAVRALERRDDAAARAELATAVAAWSTWAGGGAGGHGGPVPLGPSVAHPHRPEAPAGGPAEEPEESEAAVLDAARRGAGAFVTRPSIFTLHAVTAPMAMLLLWPILDDDGRRLGAEALARTHAAHPPVPVEAARSLPPLSGEEVSAVADHWDAHPAKLVEACRRAHERTGDPVFVAAARQVLGR